MRNGLLNNTSISRDRLYQQWRDGVISKSEYDVLFQSIKVESQIIRSIHDVIMLKQEILFVQGKNEEALGEVNVCKGLRIDPRYAHHECPEQCSMIIKAEECYSWSRKSGNKKKCADCDWYEKVGKIFE